MTTGADNSIEAIDNVKTVHDIERNKDGEQAIKKMTEMGGNYNTSAKVHHSPVPRSVPVIRLWDCDIGNLDSI